MKLDKETNTLTLEDGSVYKVELIKKSFKRWKPKDGEKYYVPQIDINYRILSHSWAGGDPYDISLFESGEVFRTEEESRKEYNYRVMRQRVKDAIAELNDGWTPDWSDELHRKYYLVLLYPNIVVENAYFRRYQEDWKYLNTLVSVKKLRDMFTDAELKLALFEIHE